MDLKNVNTVLKLNMADTRVETSSPIRTVLTLIMIITSMIQTIAIDIFGDIFGDSDSEDNEVFQGFPIQMPENVNWTPRRAACPRAG